jgi:hypothetical protein
MKGILGSMALGIAAFLCLAAPALAQDKKAEITALIDKAIDEHTIFLNCTATERDSFGFISAAWQKDVLAVVPLLASAGFTSEEIADFTRRTSVDTLVNRQRPLGEVIDFCNSSGDWLRQSYELRFVVLELAIKKVIGGTPAN